MNKQQLVDVYAMMKLSESKAGSLVGKTSLQRVCDWHLSDFQHEYFAPVKDMVIFDTGVFGAYAEAWWEMCDAYEFLSLPIRNMFLQYASCSEMAIVCERWVENNAKRVAWRNVWHSKHDTVPLGTL